MPRLSHGHIEKERRAIIFRLTDFFENYIRDLIIRELESRYGEKWWNQGVPDDVRKECEDKMAREIEMGKPAEHSKLIYADFSHYPKIILRKDNWRNIFASCFKGKEPSNVETYFKDLKECRDTSHHHRTVSSHDVERVKVCILDLCLSKEAKDEVEKISCPEKPIVPSSFESHFDIPESYDTSYDKKIWEKVMRWIKYEQAVPIQEVLDHAVEEGLDRERIKEIIERMKREGVLFEPSGGMIKRV
jgi:hypothetical protein